MMNVIGVFAGLAGVPAAGLVANTLELSQFASVT
jgi:hypothetical protein